MEGKSASVGVTARLLNKQWNVNAAHALYHHKGEWYHVLKQFPGALFDPHGYVRFETEEEYLRAPQLRRRQHLNVRGGISSLPGYQLGEAPATPPAIDLTPPKRTGTMVYRVLRDTELARRMKVKCGHACQICGFTLKLNDGSPYIEAHHVKPLGSPHDGPDIEKNIMCVCPNHHAALDYGLLRLDRTMLLNPTGTELGADFIDYHNQHVYGQMPLRRTKSVRGREQQEPIE